MNSQEYIFPKRDFENLRKTIQERAGNSLNLGLYFDKYIRWKIENGKTEAKLQDQQLFFKDLIPEKQKDFKGAVPNWATPKKEYETYLQRFRSLKDALETQGYHCREFSAKVIWRLIVDLGAESVYETSINLHRNYAVPIIPGSAVKGCVKAYMLKGTGGKENGINQEIFGDSKQRGSVIFFDALPKSSGNSLRLDIMNVHYPDYYQKKKTPGDWMEPKPVVFLTVENIEYQFSIASKKANFAEKASASLKEAIKEMGIGAKTSSGYGYFKLTG